MIVFFPERVTRIHTHLSSVMTHIQILSIRVYELTGLKPIMSTQFGQHLSWESIVLEGKKNETEGKVEEAGVPCMM